MYCEEKNRLLEAYATATGAVAKAAIALRAVAATNNHAAFEASLAQSEEARKSAEEARLALRRHSQLHGC
jgi:hypothetical protein